MKPKKKQNMKRIQSFRAFKTNESLDASMHHDNVRIFEVDQYEEFFDHVNDLKATLGVKCFWSLHGQESFWHRYLRGGNKFAVIETGDQNKNKAIIGALLDEEGKVMMASYNEDSPCTLEVAENHLGPKLFHKNESVNSGNDDQDMVCRKCGCDCDVCECNECDCGTEDSSSMDKYVESNEWTMELSPELIQAIDKGDEDSVHALLEAGADLSYRNYYPVKRAIKAAHKAKNNKRAFDTQMDILETIITELDYIGQDAVDEIMIQIEDVSSDIAVFVKNKLAEIEVMDAEPVAQKEFERFSMFERKKASTSYAKSGLKNPKKADLDKDKKISGYEKVRGKAVQKSLQAQKEEESGTKGLTAAQKKLPAGLQKAILAKKKKK